MEKQKKHNRNDVVDKYNKNKLNSLFQTDYPVDNLVDKRVGNGIPERVRTDQDGE